MKEVFIKLNGDSVRWFGPKTSGSEPILDGEGSENAIGRVIKGLVSLSRARGEDWSFRFHPSFGGGVFGQK